MLNVHRNVMHTGFALYGLRGINDEPASAYFWAVDLFNRFGCSPDLADADIQGKTNGNYKPFRKIDKKIRAAGFEGVTHWSLVDVPKEFEGKLPGGQVDGQKLAVSYGSRMSSDCLVFHARESTLKNAGCTVLEVAKAACNLLRPSYGLVFHRLFRFGPGLYGLGVQKGLDGYIGEDPELLKRALATNGPDDDNMDYWRTLVAHQTYTLLRSVYPNNLLTESQLGARVGSIRLEDWIALGINRGALSPCTDEMVLWTVPDDRIWPVRNELWNAGVILDRKRHFEDVMDEYHIGEEEICKHYREGTPLVRRPRGPGMSAEDMKSNILAVFDGESSRKKPAD